MNEIEKTLLHGLEVLDMSREIATLVMSWLQKENQQRAMISWMLKHYQENPDYRTVLDIAEAIKEQVK